MRTIKATLSIGYPTAKRVIEFEVDDDATEEEIDCEAEALLMQYVDWGWREE